MHRLARFSDELMALVKEENFFLWHAVTYTYQGIVMAAGGEEHRARNQMLEGLELFTQTGSRLTLVMMNVLCAEALYRLGHDDDAFRRLEVAEAEMRAREEGLLAPEIWRVRGRLLERQGDQKIAEKSYCQAMQEARRQDAISLELRAALDLYELWAKQGRQEEGRTQLARVAQQFNQGFDQTEIARAHAIVRGET
jgi:predicted negative regulator of RcsB-dependent stress response